MDADRTHRQLRLIADTVAMSERLGVQIWLRGGWAMDFFRGDVTRDRVDIDWFAWIADAPAIASALHADGFQTISGPPPDQQLDVAKDGEASGGWPRERTGQLMWPVARMRASRGLTGCWTGRQGGSGACSARSSARTCRSRSRPPPGSGTVRHLRKQDHADRW